MSNCLQSHGLQSMRLFWILQARILEWIAITCSRVSSTQNPKFYLSTSWLQGSNLGLLNCRWILYHLSHQGRIKFLYEQWIMWHCTLPDFHLFLLETNSFQIMSAMKDSSPSRITIKRIEIIKCLLAKHN